MKRTAPASTPGTAGFTVMVTLEAVLAAPLLSVTTSANVSGVALATAGAMKAAWAVLPLKMVTELPAVCVQEYETMEPSGSELAEPSSATVLPPKTSWAGPAFAVGTALGLGGIDLSLAWPPQADSSRLLNT